MRVKERMGCKPGAERQFWLFHPVFDNVSSLWYSDEARRGRSVRIFGRRIPVAAL